MLSASAAFQDAGIRGGQVLACCPAFNALHKRRRCQETDLGFVPKYLPAEGTTAAFDFCGSRHVPLAAQRSKLSKFSAQVKGDDVAFWLSSDLVRCPLFGRYERKADAKRTSRHDHP
jgi:hypothetical protein